MKTLMTPETFTDGLKESLGDRLTMVALFGSAAVGDTASSFSDVNIMVVCTELGVEELDSIAALSRGWAKIGNPPPLMFALERLMNSSDVFPIELLDIKENHRVLYGRDVLRDLPISQENLRFQLEHELKGKLIQLREEYMLAGQHAETLMELMLHSLSNFQILLKAALRFCEVNVPARKRDAVSNLSRHVSFDLSIFEKLQSMKDGSELPPFSRDGAKQLFERYLGAIEKAADHISASGKRVR